MNIFKKAFKGVPLGTIYPVQYEPGHQCPPELIEQATAAGVLEAGAHDTPSTPPSVKDETSSQDNVNSPEVGDEPKTKKAKNGKAPEDNQDSPET